MPNGDRAASGDPLLQADLGPLLFGCKAGSSCQGLLQGYETISSGARGGRSGGCCKLFLKRAKWISSGF